MNGEGLLNKYTIYDSMYDGRRVKWAFVLKLDSDPYAKETYASCDLKPNSLVALKDQIKVNNCYIIDPETDENAVIALRKYAELCKDRYPVLSSDLLEKAAEYERVN